MFRENPRQLEQKSERSERFNPEIEIASANEVKPQIYFYALNKAIDNNWGREQNENMALTIRDKLSDVDLSKYGKRYEEIRKRANNNKELLDWLSLAIGKTAHFKDEVVENMMKNKNFKEEEARKLMADFDKLMNEFASDFNPGQDIDDFLEKDVEKRREDLEELKGYLKDAIGFFKPSAKDVAISKIFYLPTNPLKKTQSGNGIKIGDKFLISAEEGNRINQVHEFLHSFINPIAEKINFSKEDEEKILALSPEKLRNHYGNPRSILTEELIRAYKTGFVPENKPCLENFKEKVRQVPKEKLEKILKAEGEKGEAMAKDADKLLENDDILKMYYDKYVRDEFAERVWNFYENYQNSGSKNFEDFLVNNYKKIISN